ncbi:helix-hairpin-helix domain-containing protein [Aeromonas caviae]
MLGSHARFKGVGPVKARKLWSTFGESLFEILDNGDVVSLHKILSESTAKNTIDAWRSYITVIPHLIFPFSRLDGDRLF